MYKFTSGDKLVDENIKKLESIAKETYRQIAEKSNTVGELIENLNSYIIELRHDYRCERFESYFDLKFREYFLEDMKRVPIGDTL